MQLIVSKAHQRKGPFVGMHIKNRLDNNNYMYDKEDFNFNRIYSA